MRCGRTFRLARTHPADARSSGSGTLLRSRSLADYTIDMHESEFSEATRRNLPNLGRVALRGIASMSNDETPSARYRSLAQECIEAANAFPPGEERNVLLQM